MAGLKNAEFSQRCAHIASRAASWAGDALMLPEEYERAVSSDTVARFTDELRGTLDRIDAQAGRRGAEAREAELVKALKAMLAHSCVADSAAEDKDEEDHAAERLARAALRSSQQNT